MRIISTSVDDGTSARTIPSSMISNAVVIAAAGVAIMCGSTDSTRADIPQIDIEGTCRAAARAMVSLMGGSTTEQDRKACLDSEQKAREQTKQLIRRPTNDGACEHAIISRAMWNGSPASRWKGM